MILPIVLIAITELPEHNLKIPYFSPISMKTPILYIETKKKFNNSDINLSLLDNLPGKTISLASTIQYIELIPLIKKYLEKIGKKVIIKSGSAYPGHIIGCQSHAFDKTADILLMLADGKFHALNNSIQLNREIYVFNTRALEKTTNQDLEAISKRIKAKQSKFLNSETIGLILSTKTGQRHSSIENLKQKIQNLNKNTYIFESDTINLQELENFPNIDIWINTACYGLALDSQKIINLQDILEFI